MNDLEKAQHEFREQVKEAVNAVPKLVAQAEKYGGVDEYVDALLENWRRKAVIDAIQTGKNSVDIYRKTAVFAINQLKEDSKNQLKQERQLSGEENLFKEAVKWENTVDAVFLEIQQMGVLPSQPVRMLKITPLVLQLLKENAVTKRKITKNGVYASPHLFDGKHPNVTADMLKQIPVAMTDPIAIFDSDSKEGKKKGDVIFVLELKDANGATVITPVCLNAKGRLGLEINLAKSSYAKERDGVPLNGWFEQQAKKNARYVNGQKFKQLLGIGSGANSPFVAHNASGNTIFTEADLVNLFKQYPTHYQEEDVAKGTVTAQDGSYFIKLFHNANLSTLAHEMGHIFFLELERAVRQGHADHQLQADYKTLCKWVGAEEGKPLTVSQHEKLARGWEAYLMEGKAPDPELKSVFARFREWLTDIYKTVKNLGVELNDDVRDVFDRMLSIDKTARGILKESDVLNDWCHDCVTHNLPEIGQSALCVDLEEGRVFTDFEPTGRIRPRDENTVVISVYDPDSPEPQNEAEKAGMMKSLEEKALFTLTEALQDRSERQNEKAQQEKQELEETKSRKKGRGR